MANIELLTARYHRILASALLALCAVGIGSCNKDDNTPKGTLVVPFQLGAGKSCDEVGILKVKATLDNNEDESKQVTCSKHEVRFDDLEIGVYTIKLYGFNAESVAIMDSVVRDDVRVEKDNTVTVDPPVLLSNAPAQLKLRWDLGFGNCQNLNIDHFQLTAWSSDGNSLLLETKLACAGNEVDEDSYSTVSDPDRKLDATNFGALQVQPVDAKGNSIGSNPPAKFTFDSPGPGGTVMLSVDCDSNGCKGSGEAD